MRDFCKERRLLRSKMRTLRGMIRKYRANLANEKSGCSGCKGNALRASVMQHSLLQQQYDKIVKDQEEAKATLGK
jgi:hypothetical protein